MTSLLYTLNTGCKKVLCASVLYTSILLPVRAQHETKPNAPFISLGGVGVVSTLSGNCFGTHYSPFASVRFGKRTEYSFGPSFKTCDSRLTGFNSRLMISLLLPEDSHTGKNGLYLLLAMQNQTNQTFSHKWVGVEEWIARNSEYKGMDFSKICFKGVQAIVGFGVAHYFTNRISTNFSVGMTAYSFRRKCNADVPLYFEPKSVGLHLATGIKIDIGRIKEGNRIQREILE